MIDIAQNHLEIIKKILHKHVPDCEVRAFGSRVLHTAKSYSDLDLVLVGEKELDQPSLNRLIEAFEESDIPFRVDLLDWNAISDSFRAIIEKRYEVIQKQCNNN